MISFELVRNKNNFFTTYFYLKSKNEKKLNIFYMFALETKSNKIVSLVFYEY